MKIVNVCLNGTYTEGFTYQENLLPKYQAALGNDVTIVAPTTSWNTEGFFVNVGEMDYVNQDGIRIVRIENDQSRDVGYKFKTYGKLAPLLDELEPEILFVHGCQFRDASTIARYLKRHPDVHLFVDSHCDYANSARSFVSKHVLHRVVWKHYARQLLPYAQKFFGVLPARVDFLVENYGLPRDKCKLLVMGADDDQVFRATSPGNTRQVRERLGVSQDDFLLVTGGKIDKNKKETLCLLDAMRKLPGGVKLVVFGPVAPELAEEFEKRASHPSIAHIAWADCEESYDYIAAADLAVFPGTHSVYWEQAVGEGIPVMVKEWPGANHVDRGGNALFLQSCSPDEISCKIMALLDNPDDYRTMKHVARDCAGEFRYSWIARQSLGM
ncbi:UNVERIFIED_ORG: glycosyl transferases group 1 family protein [Clostridioides difficile F501]